MTSKPRKPTLDPSKLKPTSGKKRMTVTYRPEILHRPTSTEKAT